ncbi:MAG: O-antigen ligase family protein, partial [Thermodesulfobacteriota bacterium]
MAYITLKQLIKVVLLIALSITLGKAVASMPGFSVGTWLQNLAPAAFFGVLLFLFQIEALPIKWSDWVTIMKLPDKRELSIKSVLVLIGVAVITGLALIHYGFGLTITLSILLAVAGIVISGILITTDKQAAGLSLLIITMPIVHFLEFQFRVIHSAYHGIFYTMPSIIILWITAFVFLVTQLSMKRSFVKTPFNKVWLIMLIPMLLSATFSSDYIVSFRHVFYFVSVSIPFFLATNIIKSIGELKLCAISLALAAGIRALTILYFEMGKMSAGFEYEAKLYSNLPSYVGVLGMGVILCFFLSFGLILNEESKLKRILVIGIITGLMLVTVLKLPRSMDIAIACGMPFLLLIRKTRPWVIAGLIATTLALFSSWDFIKEHTALGRFEKFSSVESLRSSQKMRIDGYQAALSIIKDYPIFGIGPGMWDEYYFRYMKDPVVWMIRGIPTAAYIRGSHNIFLQHGT